MYLGWKSRLWWLPFGCYYFTLTTWSGPALMGWTHPKDLRSGRVPRSGMKSTPLVRCINWLQPTLLNKHPSERRSDRPQDRSLETLRNSVTKCVHSVRRSRCRQLCRRQLSAKIMRHTVEFRIQLLQLVLLRRSRAWFTKYLTIILRQCPLRSTSNLLNILWSAQWFSCVQCTCKIVRSSEIVAYDIPKRNIGTSSLSWIDFTINLKMIFWQIVRYLVNRAPDIRALW